MANIHWRAVSAGLFLPLLYWAGAVTAINFFGYPGIVCITPLAWLLALPVGMRAAHECGPQASERAVRSSAAAGGAMLGLFQALLMTGMLPAASTPEEIGNAMLSPLLVTLIAFVVGVPVTGGLSLLGARLVRRQMERA